MSDRPAGQRVTDEQLDEWEHKMQPDRPYPIALGYKTQLDLIADLRTARAERDEALAMVKRLAPAASRYDQRVYRIHELPAFVTEHLSEEDLWANGERPSESDRRVLAERDRLQQRIDKALAGHHRYLPPAVDFDCCSECNRLSNSYVPFEECQFRSALTG